MCITCAVWTAVLRVASCILGESILSQRQRKKPLGTPAFVVYHRPHTLRVGSSVTQSKLKMKNLSPPKKKKNLFRRPQPVKSMKHEMNFYFFFTSRCLQHGGRHYKKNAGCVDTSEKPMYNPNMKSRTRVGGFKNKRGAPHRAVTSLFLVPFSDQGSDTQPKW